MTPRIRRLSIERLGAREMFAASPVVYEAETATLVAPMVAKDGSISSPTNMAGSATLTFTAAATGSHKIEALVFAPSKSSDALSYSIDGGKSATVRLPTGKWTWVTLTTTNLTAGNHTLKIIPREGGVLVDKIRDTGPDVTTPDEPDPPGTLDPNKAPGENFDLRLWKVTLPIDKNGGKTGGAIEYKPIPTTLEIEPYFYTGADGAMVFSTPTDGATTSGSSYPRSELRELDASGGLAAWTVAQGGRLTATLAVNSVPTATKGTSHVVIGQIHGPDDELCRLYFDRAGKLYYANDKSGASNKELKFDLKDSAGRVSAIPLGAKFDYSIIVAGGRLTVSAVYNGVTYSASETITSFWDGGLYFKAGMYSQVGKPGSSAGSTGTGVGTASFYALSVSH